MFQLKNDWISPKLLRCSLVFQRLLSEENELVIMFFVSSTVRGCSSILHSFSFWVSSPAFLLPEMMNICSRCDVISAKFRVDLDPTYLGNFFIKGGVTTWCLRSTYLSSLPNHTSSGWFFVIIIFSFCIRDCLMATI